MKKAVLMNLWFAFLVCCNIQINAQTHEQPLSVANPINLNYRFQLEPAPSSSCREAADPVVVLFKDQYFLFASKSGGYWHSTDLINWSFITTKDLPLEDYAPAAVVMDDAVYFMALDRKIYKSANPQTGKWKVVKENFSVENIGDPALFLDDDGRLYFYSGLSNRNPIYAIELDRKTFDPIGEQTECIFQDRENLGWERTGDYNTNMKMKPWLEGAWMNKHNGKYYLQYSAPGTQFKSYVDACYVGDSPLGPFKVAVHNPFAYKPEGFIAGAGHGSTFYDKWGNLWHAGTMTISVKHQFERRLGLFPAFFDQSGTLYTYTGFGDFPHTIPQEKINSPDDYPLVGMLLSYKKLVEVSSAASEFPKENAVNEDVRTYWSAATGNAGEWIMIDLEDNYQVNAIQINFAEEGAKLFDRPVSDYHQYLLEYSKDKKKWKTLADKRQNKTAVPHDYLELKKAVPARYIRLTNQHVPDGKFALSGLRVFGKGKGKRPAEADSFEVTRNKEDACQVTLKWNKISGATGYNIRYGTQPDKLYHNYQVLDTDSLDINTLNSGLKYYFTIDVFNENGVTKGKKIKEG